MANNINHAEIWNAQFLVLKDTKVNDPLAALSESQGLLKASLLDEEPEILSIACGLTSVYPMEISDMNKAAINKRYVGCLSFTKMLNNKFSDVLEHFSASNADEEG